MIKRYQLTEREREVCRLYDSLGNKQAVANELGLSRGTVNTYLERANRKRESRAAFTPADVPEGSTAFKTTVEYDSEGNPVREWRRLAPEAQALEKLTEQLCEKVKGKGKAAKYRPKKTDTDEQLLEVAISDPHIGMYAWANETGQGDYDVSIATDTVLQAVVDIAGRCRPAETILVLNGDTIHADNRAARTEHSGNVLDVDGRYARVLDHTINCVRESIDICAERSPRVKLLVTPGNHDWHTATCLSRIFHGYYHDAANVEVIVTSRPRYAMQWGECMLAWAHGDRVKPDAWAKIIPTEFHEMWGRTTMRYLHLGHVHHKRQFAPVMVDEQCGLVVEYLSALCQTDAWHAESGYIGTIRGADGFLYNKSGLDTRWSFNAKRFTSPKSA